MTRESGQIHKDPFHVARMFDAIAPRYDVLNHLLSAGLDRRWRTAAIAALDLTGAETVLDLCTGTGDLAMAAVRRRAGGAARVIGVDFAGAMLRRGRAKAVERALTRTIAFVRGDAVRIPLPDAAVDAVTIGFGIRNVEDPRKVCDEIARVLRPGGKLAIVEFGLPTLPVLGTVYRWYFTRILPVIGRLISRHSDAYTYLPASVGAFLTPDAMSRLLRESGFQRVRNVPLSFGIVYLYAAVRA